MLTTLIVVEEDGRGGLSTVKATVARRGRRRTARECVGPDERWPVHLRVIERKLRARRIGLRSMEEGESLGGGSQAKNRAAAMWVALGGCSRRKWSGDRGNEAGAAQESGGSSECALCPRKGRRRLEKREARSAGGSPAANGRVVHAREARRRRADWGGDSRGVKVALGNVPMAAPIGGGGSSADRMRARRKIKPASNRAHASVDGCSEVGQGSLAIFSENVNCAQNFVKTNL